MIMEVLFDRSVDIRAYDARIRTPALIIVVFAFVPFYRVAASLFCSLPSFH